MTLQEVTILFAFAAYQKDQMSIGDITQPPVNLLPLCETPKDLANLDNIIVGMLENRHLRKWIADQKQLSLVLGPSDLGKVGGVFTLVQMVNAAKGVEDLLAQYKIKYPELQDVELWILYGLGGDLRRRSSASFKQLHATFQGVEAHALASPGAYEAYLKDVVCKPHGTMHQALADDVVSNISTPKALEQQLEILHQKYLKESLK